MKSRLTLVLLLAQFAHAQPAKPGHWVATWGTAQLLVRPLPPATPPATPPAKQAPAAQGFTNQTVRTSPCAPRIPKSSPHPTAPSPSTASQAVS